MPRITIITTAYRHEKFIAETIESVLAQTRTDWELLIGDDSPDDKTWDIVWTYAAKYPDKIRAWHHAPNRWLVENMNFLVSQSDPASEYVAFLEWDDRYAPDCLREKLDIFESHPQIGLVYSDMSFIDATGKSTLESLFWSKNTKLYRDETIPMDEYVTSRDPLIVSYSSAMIRKSVLMEFFPIGDPGLPKTYAVSDYDLFCRIASVHRVFGIGKPLTEYRRHAGNLSSAYGGLFRDLGDLVERYRREWWISEKTHREKMSWIRVLTSVSYLSAWEKTQAFQAFRASLSYSLTYGWTYKAAVAVLLLLPSSWSLKIVKSRIRRGE